MFPYLFYTLRAEYVTPHLEETAGLDIDIHVLSSFRIGWLTFFAGLKNSRGANDHCAGRERPQSECMSRSQN